MGWWKTGDGELVGDGPLDTFEESISRVVEEYLQGQGRKPTLQEILSCFRLALGSGLEEYVAPPEDIEILSLVARTKIRPKRRKLTPGTIFAAPLGDGHYAFGRLTPQSGVAEFYCVKSPKRRLSARKLQNFSTFRLESILPDEPFQDGSWVAYENIDYPLDDFKWTTYRIGNRVTCGTTVIDGFVDVSSATRPATDDEISSLKPFAISNTTMVQLRLRQALSEAPIA